MIAMVPPVPEPAPVLLDAEQADELRRLLGTVEDWLLHAGDEARRRPRPSSSPGSAGRPPPPERLIAALISRARRARHPALARASRTPAATRETS